MASLYGQCLFCVGVCDQCYSSLWMCERHFWVDRMPLGGMALCRSCCSSSVRNSRIETSAGTYLQTRAYLEQNTPQLVEEMVGDGDLDLAPARPLFLVHKLRVLFGDETIRGRWVARGWVAAGWLACALGATVWLWIGGVALGGRWKVVLTVVFLLLPTLRHLAAYLVIRCTMPWCIINASPMQRLYIVSRMHWSPDEGVRQWFYNIVGTNTDSYQRVQRWMGRWTSRVLYKPRLYDGGTRPLMNRLTRLFRMHLLHNRHPVRQHSSDTDLDVNGMCLMCKTSRATQVCDRCSSTSLCGSCARAVREHPSVSGCPGCPVSHVQEDCVICMEKTISHAFKCRHLCVCEECIQDPRLKDCPICRKPSKAVRVWNGGLRRCLVCEKPGCIDPNFVFGDCFHPVMCTQCAETEVSAARKLRCPLCKRRSQVVRLFRSGREQNPTD